ncbi:MAG: hypothetical protein ACO1O4_09170 [Devosia sp.]
MGPSGVLRALLLPVIFALFLQPLALLNAHPSLTATHADGVRLCDEDARHSHSALGDDHAEEQVRPMHKHEPTKHLHDPPIGQEAFVLLACGSCHSAWHGAAMLAAMTRRPADLYRPPRQA